MDTTSPLLYKLYSIIISLKKTTLKKLLIILLLIPLISFGQNKKNDTIHKTQNIKLNYKSAIIPSVLIGYGIIGIDNNALKRFNYEVQEELKGQIGNNICLLYTSPSPRD